MPPSPEPTVASAADLLDDLTPVLRALFNALSEASEFDRASVVLTDDDGAMTTAAAIFQNGVLSHQEIPVSRSVRDVIEAGVPLINADLRPADGTSQVLIELGIRSTVIAPLRASGVAVGTLNVGTRRAAPYDEHDLERVVAVAARFSGVLDRARRFRSASKRLEPGEASGSFELPAAALLLRPGRIVDHISEGLVIRDVDGRVVFANRAFRTLLGIGAESTEIDFERYVAEESIEAFRSETEARLRGGGSHGYLAYRGRRQNGSRVDLEASMVPIVEDGVTLGTQSMIRDVSHRRAAEQRAAHAAKMEALGHLAGGVAHDFNNLLTAMVAYPDIARSKLEEGLDIEEELAEIERSAERAAALTRQLLTFSRKDIVRAKRVDLGESLAQLIPLLRRLIGANVRLPFDGLEAPHVVLIDPGQLEQIVINLVVNARDAGATEIRVSVGHVVPDQAAREDFGLQNAPYAVLSIVDDGAGMSDEVQQHVFQPFFTTKSVGEGTGLGLSTVFGIVNRASGTIAITSALGRGSRFDVYLPSSEAPATRRSSRPPLSHPAASRILVAEDDPVVRRVLTTLLERAGMSVTVVPDGAKAIEQLRDPNATYDLVLSDLVMPHAGGPEVLAAARERDGKMPVLLMSGYAAGDLARVVPDLEVQFVEKPIRRERLLAAVHDALEGMAGGG